MTGEAEAAGAAVTAGLVAAAIDDAKHGRGPVKDGVCANCGGAVSGNFCATCGQPARVHRKLGHMVEEFLHAFLHFDTRAWRTLPLLILRPGTLTRDYIEGRRTRYVSPLAMFLLAVFAMFFVFELSEGARSPGLGIIDSPTEALDDRIDELRDAADRIRDVREATPAAGIPALDAELAELETRLEAVQQERDDIRAGRKPPPSPVVVVEPSGERRGGTVNVGWKPLNEAIEHSLENPELALYKVQNAASHYAFLLAPISLPFVWLMFFWKRGVTLFDHIVYILYSLSFVSLLFIAWMLVSRIPGAMGWLTAPLLIAGPVHAFFHLKGGYKLKTFSALWRMPVLLVFALICLLIFLVLILVLGLAT